ncbi:MAG: LPXTG cell wall anchor domain-containing protein [Acidimicrobiia bacterium]
MQRTATTTKIGFGLAGAFTLSLAFAPAAFANEAPMDETLVEETPIEKVVQAPFLDLLYAAPHQNLHIGDSTTVVIAQTLPASYTLTSYLANGNKCFVAYDAPAADWIKSGTEQDADQVVRTIVSSGVDADDNGIDDHYEGAYDENGIAACKIKVVDEFGNMDWKYIYINVGLPKTHEVPTDTTVKTPAGDDFDAGATTTAAPVPTTAAPAAATTTPQAVAGTTVAPTNTVEAATLPRTGSATWIEALIGTTLAAAGAAMVTFSRRRAIAAEVRSNG